MLQNLNTCASIKQALKKVKNSLVHLVYPTQCLHCKTLLAPSSQVLCDCCSFQLELIAPEDRCPHCFNKLQEEAWQVCQQCLHDPHPYIQMGSVFDYEGPAATLVRQLKYANCSYLSSGMGAYMYAQFYYLQWPMPDIILPIPLSFAHWFERGYNQSALLAQELSYYLHCPVKDLLKRRHGDFSQAALSYEKRHMLTAKSFKISQGFSIKGKTLLLIDDVLTTGTTLRSCAEILKSEGCGNLYALTFCRTLA